MGETWLVMRSREAIPHLPLWGEADSRGESVIHAKGTPGQGEFLNPGGDEERPNFQPERLSSVVRPGTMKLCSVYQKR
jgi:hypothetical protein